MSNEWSGMHETPPTDEQLREQARKNRRRRIFEQVFIAESSRVGNPERGWIAHQSERLIKWADEFAEKETEE